jgi:hypothetical protein
VKKALKVYIAELNRTFDQAEATRTFLSQARKQGAEMFRPVAVAESTAYSRR